VASVVMNRLDDEPSRCGPLAQSLSQHDPPLPRLDVSNSAHYMKYAELKDRPSDESCLPSFDVLKQDNVEIEERKQSDKQTKAKHGDGIFRQGRIPLKAKTHPAEPDFLQDDAS
jgi:hypothetical protein